MIDLHPPQKVSIPYVLMDRIYLYWEHPINFKIHDPSNETHIIAVDMNGTLILAPRGPGVSGKGPGVTHAVLTLNGTVGSVNKSSENANPQQNGTSSSTSSDGNADKQQQNSTAKSGDGTENSDKNSENGKETGIDKTNQNKTTGDTSNNNNNTANSATNSSDSGPNIGKDGKANVTEIVKDNTNTSASSNSSDAKADNSTPAVTKQIDKTTVKPPTVTVKTNSSDPNIRYELEDFYWKKKVPFHFAVLGHYIVSYKTDSDGKFMYTFTEQVRS